MKQIYISILIILLTTCALKAQTTDVASGLNQPQEMILDGTNLYVTEFIGKLSVIDISQSSPVVNNIATNVTGATDVIIYNNDLYISYVQNGGGIKKIAIGSSGTIATDVITSDVIPSYLNIRGMALHNNYIYFTEATNGNIFRIDISSSNPAIENVISGLNTPIGLEVKGDFLYISEQGTSKILKSDLTISPFSTTDVVTMPSPPSNLLFVENTLLVTHFSSSLGKGKVMKVENLDGTPSVLDLLTTLNEPTGLEFDESNNRLYFGSQSTGKIVYFEGVTLSIENNPESNPKYALFPNPSVNFIQISGLISKNKYRIFNLPGVEIKSGIISNNEQIDIRNFKNGLYFLRFDNGNTIKFIKE